MMARLPGGAGARDVRCGNEPGLPGKILTGRILILAPHMDDETLACGGAMLLHSQKEKIHCLFATDGAASPAPLLPWTGSVDADLADRRRREARAVAGKIGIPPANLKFLDLPDGGLSACRPQLAAALRDLIGTTHPDFVFAPFRYDVHPDHTALNHVTRAVLREMQQAPTMLEYFVYHRLRFVPGGDVRRALDKALLVTVDTSAVAAAKREALDCYRSQTTVRYAWQDRPILTDESLNLRCSEPEYFLRADPAAPLSEGIAAHRRRIQLACLATRFGKRPKDRAAAFMRWLLER
jgi:LmbE family N-acetylglucosaminyl deacetylase